MEPRAKEGDFRSSEKGLDKVLLVPVRMNTNSTTILYIRNHYHVVLHVPAEIANTWSEREVVTRWQSLFNGTLFSQRFINGEPISEAQWSVLRKDIKRWRKRLCDISWFKRGHIDSHLPGILTRLSLDAESWKILTTEFEDRFQCWVGSEHIVRRVCEDQGYQPSPSIKTHETLFKH